MNSSYVYLSLLQIGFVFSTAFPQYASRSTQYEINWLRFFNCLSAIRITHYAIRNRLALFFQLWLVASHSFLLSILTLSAIIVSFQKLTSFMPFNVVKSVAA
jgi:hypothetical protein